MGSHLALGRGNGRVLSHAALDSLGFSLVPVRQFPRQEAHLDEWAPVP